MVTFDDYFRTVKHIESKTPEAVLRKGVDSTTLAEVMELAEQNGYEYKLHCYDEVVHLSQPVGDITQHVREMLFTPKEVDSNEV